MASGDRSLSDSHSVGNKQSFHDTVEVSAGYFTVSECREKTTNKIFLTACTIQKFCKN